MSAADQSDRGLEVSPATRQFQPSGGPDTRKIGEADLPVGAGPGAQPTRQHPHPVGPETQRPQLFPEAQASDEYITRNLPPALASLFAPIRDLASGGQAAVLLCERKAEPKDRVAIKLYNAAAPTLEDDPRELLRSIPTDYVVGYVDPEFGIAGGKWWDVHEFLELGSVRDFAATQGGRLEPEQLTELLKCMVDALDHLHHREPKVIHRDVKPANILLRSADPLRAVLADFGLAVLTDSTMTMRSTSRTEAYASPEAAAGDTRPARDWWSLGMTIAELAVGRHPYQLEDGRFLQEGTIQSALATKPVPLEHIEDPHLLLLLRGLLTKDPDQRWSASQVRAWLVGDEPELGTEWTSPGRPSRPDVAILRFMGKEFSDPTMLARAIKEDWRGAGKRLAGRDLDRLVDWIDDVAAELSIRGLVSTYQDARRGAGDPTIGNLNLLMAKIVTRLDPDGDATFMGEPVDLKSLSGWAARFGKGTAGQLKDVVDQLFQTAALHEYRRMPAHSRLEDVQNHWEDLISQSDRYFTQVPQAGGITPETRAVCLRLAVARVAAEMQA